MSTGNFKHGHRTRTHRSKEYAAWSHMMQRCNNPKDRRYPDYGGRGIRVCERWRKFENFLADVRLATSPEHSLDRYPDNNGHYEPENVRWATDFEQSQNKRNSNPLLVLNGQTKGLNQWAAEVGIPATRIRVRLRIGWSTEAALTTPMLDRMENLKTRQVKGVKRS